MRINFIYFISFIFYRFDFKGFNRIEESSILKYNSNPFLEDQREDRSRSLWSVNINYLDEIVNWVKTDQNKNNYYLILNI
jgi:hypothetical protein